MLVVKGAPALRSKALANRTAAAQAENELAVARASMHSMPLLRDSLLSLQARLVALHEQLVTGETSWTAAAELASTVGETAADADLIVGAVTVDVDSTPVPGLVRLRVTGNAVGDMLGIMVLVRTLEGEARRYRLQSITLSRNSHIASIESAEELRLAFSLEALALIVPPVSSPETSRATALGLGAQ
ncbi:MAG: hypothetical protein ACYC2K_12490 [Gemmatimonadales bacterium]